MSSKCHVFADKQAAAAGAAVRILELLRAAVEQSGQATLVLAGGSTPKLMFESMAAAGFNWKGVHLFWVDERCVPPDHPDSNYRMTRQALLEPAGIAPDQVHRIQGELPPKQAALQYENDIRRFFHLAEGMLPQFDVVHLGMGDDAHMASLFPGEPLLDDRNGIAAAVYSQSRQSHRVTLLPGTLLSARSILFLVTGDDKAIPLRDVLEGPPEPFRLPAQLVAREGENPDWFLDDAAAGRLSQRGGS